MIRILKQLFYSQLVLEFAGNVKGMLLILFGRINAPSIKMQLANYGTKYFTTMFREHIPLHNSTCQDLRHHSQESKQQLLSFKGIKRFFFFNAHPP